MAAQSYRATVVFALLAGVLAVGAYSNSLHGPFTLDDRIEIVTNATIVDLGQPLVVLFGHGITRPLVNLSYALDYAWNGRKEFGFHVTSVVLHTANVLLLFVLVRWLVQEAARNIGRPSSQRQANLTAFLSASLFAVHPMMTEAVSYISARSDLLVTTFFLSALYCFRRGFESGGRWLAAGVVCFLLALGSKETAVMFPFVLIVSDILVAPESWRSRLSRVHLPLLSLVVLLAVARSMLYVTVEHHDSQNGLTLESLALQMHVLIRYLSLLIYPVGQTVVAQVSPVVSLDDRRIIVATIVLGGLAAGAFAARRDLPLVTLGWVWFFLALLPSSILVLLSPYGQSMSEHRTYLASGGFFMAIATLVMSVVRGVVVRDRLPLIGLTTTAAAVLGLLLFLTVSRNRVWASSVRLWEEAVQRSPETMFAHLLLGQEYRLAGNCDAAQVEFRRAIELAPNRSQAYLGSAGCFLELQRPTEAREILQAALTRMPQEARLRLPLAAIEEFGFRRPQEALRLCREAMVLEPGLEEAKECITRNEAKLSASSR